MGVYFKPSIQSDTVQYFWNRDYHCRSLNSSNLWETINIEINYDVMS